LQKISVGNFKTVKIQGIGQMNGKVLYFCSTIALNTRQEGSLYPQMKLIVCLSQQLSSDVNN
jgi:hypothetical protein